MCRVIAIANQKGGVGKTTTCVNLGIGLAREGKKVLLVETDAQGSMAISLGIREPDELHGSYWTKMGNWWWIMYIMVLTRLFKSRSKNI